MSNRSKRLIAALLAAVALVALSACSSGGGSPGGALPGGALLDGTHWRLSEWTLSSLDPADFSITAQFAKGQISGHSGVNTYGGPYEAGPGDAFSAGPLASTEMAGPEPAMRAETAYLSLLGRARSFKVAGGRLTLYDEGGNESLIFSAADK
jgi:heat shock protein HslJ